MTDEHLTPREVEVALLAADGMTVREISERLYLSIGTVKTHLVHVYARLGVKNRAELAKYLFKGAKDHPNG